MTPKKEDVKMTHDELSSHLTSIASSCRETNIKWKLFNDLNESIDKYELEFNDSRFFWGCCLNAMSDVVVLALTRIYDKSCGAASLYNALKSIKALDPDILNQQNQQQFNDDFEFVDPQTNRLVKNLKELRNKVIAHTDSDGIKNSIDWSDRYPLKICEVSQLAKSGWEIARRYHKLLNPTHVWSHPKPDGDDDYLTVLKSVRHYMKHRE